MRRKEYTLVVATFVGDEGMCTHMISAARCIFDRAYCIHETARRACSRLWPVEVREHQELHCSPYPVERDNCVLHFVETDRSALASHMFTLAGDCASVWRCELLDIQTANFGSKVCELPSCGEA